MENLKEQEKKSAKKILFDYEDYMKIKKSFVESELTTDAYNRFYTEDSITSWNGILNLHEIDLIRIRTNNEGRMSTYNLFHYVFACLMTETNFTTVIRIRKKIKN